MNLKIIFIAFGIIALLYIMNRLISYFDKSSKEFDNELTEIINNDDYKVKGQYE